MHGLIMLGFDHEWINIAAALSAFTCSLFTDLLFSNKVFENVNEENRGILTSANAVV